MSDWYIVPARSALKVYSAKSIPILSIEFTFIVPLFSRVDSQGACLLYFHLLLETPAASVSPSFKYQVGSIPTFALGSSGLKVWP